MGYHLEEECSDCGASLEETALGAKLCPECNAEDFKIDDCLFLDDVLDDLERDPPGREGQSGCFIATAAYGSYAEPNVLVLREFRDTVLCRNLIGRLFINSYYKISHPIADLIAPREYAKKVVRTILQPVVSIVKKINKGN